MIENLINIMYEMIMYGVDIMYEMNMYEAGHTYLLILYL